MDPPLCGSTVISHTEVSETDELVASFANRPNLLKYEEKTHVYVASTPLKRVGKTYGDHPHTVPRSAAASHTFF